MTKEIKKGGSRRLTRRFKYSPKFRFITLFFLYIKMRGNAKTKPLIVKNNLTPKSKDFMTGMTTLNQLGTS